MTYSYHAYGLKILSEIQLPEFLESDSVAFDLEIRTVPIENTSFHFPSENPYYYSADETTFINIPSSGVFSIRQGREIVIALEEGVDPNRLHLYLTGNIIAFLLLQRGYLVLHASAACVDGRAAAFLGMPGAGKSSLAAALYQIGHNILVDDVAAVDLNADPISIIPAFPQIKLDEAAAESLGIDTGKLVLLDEEEEKLGFRFAERFMSASQPLSKIYILTDRGDKTFQPISPQEAILELVRNSYPTRFAQAGGAEHFLQCSELVKHVPMFRLKKPQAAKDLPGFAAKLADHILSIAA
jgi:hypothetical protein